MSDTVDTIHEDVDDEDSVWVRLASEVRLEQTEVPPDERGFFKRLFSGLYDNLGTLMLLNVAVFVQTLPGALLVAASTRKPVSALGVAFALLILTLVAAPAFGGLFHYVRCLEDPDEAKGLKQYFAGMRRYARRSWLLMGGQVFTGAVIAMNVVFYGNLKSAPGAMILVFILSLGLVWAMACSYSWPLLVQDISWRLLIRNSIFIALAAPISTIVMLVLLTALSALLIATGLGLMLFVFSIWAMTESACLMRLVRIFRARAEAQSDAAG